MKPIIITGLDFETTGFEPSEGHRITEVGAVVYKVDPKTLEFTQAIRYSKLVNPQRPIPELVQNLTGITPALVRDCPTWDPISLEVSKILCATDILVAHNADFDMKFAVHELLRLERPIKESMEVFCTMQNGRFATPMGKVPKLVELCWALDVEFKTEDAHRAIYDVERMMEALQVGIRRGYYDLKPLIARVLERREEAA